jgi:hypothetical protein
MILKRRGSRRGEIGKIFEYRKGRKERENYIEDFFSSINRKKEKLRENQIGKEAHFIHWKSIRD